MPLATREDYDRAFSLVREVIAAWNPYGLSDLAHDEWEQEVAQIVAMISQIGSTLDAARAVSTTFSRAFHSDGFTPEDCEQVGAQLFEALTNAEILQARSSPAA